jgi:hypothetical protein
MTEGAWLVLRDLSSGLSDRVEIARDATMAFDERLFAVINALAFIQERTNQVLSWPGEISAVEAIKMAKVVSIIRTGRLLEAANRFEVEIGKSGAGSLLTFYRSEGEPLRYATPDYSVDMLGTILSLGPAKLVMPNAKLAEATQRRLENLAQYPDDSIIPVEFDVSDPGVLIFFERWLPESAQSIDELVKEVLEKRR